MILKTDGTLWACGSNSSGQLGDGTKLGDGTYTDRITPVQVMSGVASVVAGSSHTMILKTDGTLWACGNNSVGQLGDWKTNSSTPRQVMSGVASVTAGVAHTMILKNDGTLWACGLNKDGQLGDGTTTNSSTPKQVMSGVASVAAGYSHTMILKTDGSLWTCGYNRYGQLCDGTTIDSYTPIKIAERGNVAVTDITLDKTSLSLGVGESYRLTATVLPSNASQDVTWSSEDETIATVDEFDGTVTGVKAGTTTIGAVTDDGMHVAICQVTVTGDDSDTPGTEPQDEEFTDISQMDNVLYIEETEVTPGSQVVLSVKMKNTGRTIQSFGFNLHLPTGFSFVKDSNGKVLCGLSPERISDESEFFKYADIVEDGSLKVVVTGLDDAIISGNDGEVYQVTIKADDNANTGTHPLIMKNVTVTDIYVNPENYEHLVYPLVVPDYMLGDADGSRALDVSDLTTVVNYMFKHFDRLPPKFNFKAADVAKPKGDLDVSDLTGIVNLMFHGTISRPKNMRKRNKTINKIPQ